MVEPCSKKDTCTGYPYLCEGCWSMADIYNHYPCYTTEPKTPKIAYVCDRLACPDCSYPACRHTLDISHAANFVHFFSDGESEYRYMEKDNVAIDLTDFRKLNTIPTASYDDYEHEVSPYAD